MEAGPAVTINGGRCRDGGVRSGTDVFDAARWEPAVDAAVEQGHRVAPEVAAVWHG